MMATSAKGAKAFWVGDETNWTYMSGLGGLSKTGLLGDVRGYGRKREAFGNN